MTKQADSQKSAEQIWAELDALDSTGGTPSAGPSQDASPATETTQPTEQQTAVAQAPAPQADAQAPTGTAPAVFDQTLLDKINGLESQLQALMPLATRVRNVEGRVGGLNSDLQSLKQARESTAAAGHDAPSAAELSKAQQSPAAMEELKKDYPQFAAALEAAIESRIGSVQAQLQQLGQTQLPVPQVTPADVEALRAELTVEVAHAGWKHTVGTPEFVGWMNRQPREVQLLAESDSPRDAIRMLDLYKESRTAEGRQNNDQRLQSAAAISTTRRGTGQVRAKPVEDMSPEEYWRYLDEQEAAQLSASR